MKTSFEKHIRESITSYGRRVGQCIQFHENAIYMNGDIFHVYKSDTSHVFLKSPSGSSVVKIPIRYGSGIMSTKRPFRIKR